jgi:hypothetical protein
MNKKSISKKKIKKLNEGLAKPLPKVLYHGSSSLIKEFKIPPYGVFFSPHIAHAQEYGDTITKATVDAHKVYLLDYKNDIDDNIVDALFDRDYAAVAEFIKQLQAEGYQAMQTVTDSEMIVVFPGTPIHIIDDEPEVNELFRHNTDISESMITRHFKGLLKGL